MRFERRLAITFACMVAAGYSTLIACRNPNLYHQTEPHTRFDDTVWPIGRPFMELPWLANGKLTHDPHYVNIALNENFVGTRLEGDPNMIRRDSFPNAVRISLGPVVGGWEQVYRLEPEDPDIEWQFAFKGFRQSSFVQICRVVLNRAAKVLRGPNAYMAGGIERYSRKEIKVKVTGPFNRYNQMVDGDQI